jgi:hypothetical protein
MKNLPQLFQVGVGHPFLIKDQRFEIQSLQKLNAKINRREKLRKTGNHIRK